MKTFRSLDVLFGVFVSEFGAIGFESWVSGSIIDSSKPGGGVWVGGCSCCCTGRWQRRWQPAALLRRLAEDRIPVMGRTSLDLLFHELHGTMF